MKIEKIDIHQYHLALTHPMTVNNSQIETREGFLIKIFADNILGVGDVPPFPGLSRETLDEALGQLAPACESLIGLNFEQIKALLTPFWSFQYSPSVQFGLETALHNLLAHDSNQSLAQTLSPNAAESIITNVLLSNEMPVKRAKESVKAGFRTLKLKVGRYSADDEISVLKKIRKTVGSQVRIRLDANRNWRLEEAIEFGRAIRDISVEYIEEPIVDPWQLDSFINSTGLAVALDESLSSTEWPDFPGIDAYVIKPGIIGGIFRSADLCRKAHKRGCKAVISSAYLCAIGLSAAVHLAAAFATPGTAMGLNTSNRLKNDFSRGTLPIEEGRISLTALDDILDPSAVTVKDILHVE